MSRWPASQSPPATPNAMPVRKPTGGASSVASSVTSGGPSTKTTSSATASKAKAVCRLSRSSSAAQRARTIEPMLGAAAPVSAASRNQLHRGAPALTATTKATPDSARAAIAIRRTRPWPRRSMARAHCGPASA